MGQYVIEPRHLLNNADADQNHLSDDAADTQTAMMKTDTGFQTHASLHVAWTGVTSGSGTAKVQTSDTGGANDWEDFPSGSVTVTGASGHGIFRMPNNVTEKYLRVNYAKGTVVGGKVDAVFHAKG